ncbi:MAG: hypothetical protein HQL69_05410 [Magnetococcales bacterium]|nr:hypothetical protein [Magnetococcales bacterium]
MDITLNIPDTLAKELGEIPDSDRQAYVVDAVRERIERDKAEYEVWARKKIKEGVDAAKRGEFVPKEEMNAFFAKRGINVRD